ncbi:hypothetical protein MPER_02725, partial [Moniliophthora perniciosa FA553]
MSVVVEWTAVLADPKGTAFTISITDTSNGLLIRHVHFYCKVICSRTHTEPQVFHHPFSEKYGDQFFTLIHGEGERKGLYAIKSQRTNKVLFSRRHQEPRVWHTDGDGKYKDNWFELESGTG